MANLKLKTLPVFPTKVQGSGGISVDKSNGVYSIEPKWEDLDLSPSISANDMQVWVRDASDSTYKRVALSTLIASITAPIFVQNSAPGTDETEGSIWIDADSTDADVYQLVSGVWTDTTANLKGPQGIQGDPGSKIFVQNDAPDTNNPEGSLWIDADSSDNDLYQLTSGSWVDTGVNVKGADGLGTGDVTGPASSSVGNIAIFDNTDGKSIGDSGIGISDVLVNSDIGTTVQGYDADTLKADADDTLAAGFDATVVNDGTKSSGTYTPVYTGGNLKRVVNGGAHTLAPQASDGVIIIQYTNNSSAGAITTSSFTKVSGSFTTNNGDDFLCFLTRVNGFTHLNIVRLQ